MAVVATPFPAGAGRGARRKGLRAAALLILAGVITRWGNQPINAVFMGWTPDAPRPGWQALRDRCWRLHLIRTALSCAGYLAVRSGCLLPATSQSADR